MNAVAIYGRVANEMATSIERYRTLANDALIDGDLEAFTVWSMCGALLQDVKRAAISSSEKSVADARKWPTPESVSHVS